MAKTKVLRRWLGKRTIVEAESKGRSTVYNGELSKSKSGLIELSDTRRIERFFPLTNYSNIAPSANRSTMDVDEFDQYITHLNNVLTVVFKEEIPNEHLKTTLYNFVPTEIGDTCLSMTEGLGYLDKERIEKVCNRFLYPLMEISSDLEAITIGSDTIKRIACVNDIVDKHKS